MENSFGTQDIITGRGLGIAGFGYGYGHGAFAGPASNAVRINRNSEIAKLGLDRISDQNEETRRVLSFDRLNDRMVDAEFRQTDRLRDIQTQLSDCCCETQKEILKLEASNNLKFAELSAGQSTIIAKLDANKEIAELNAELQALKTQVACGCVTGCSTPCPPSA